VHCGAGFIYALRQGQADAPKKDVYGVTLSISG
jgi:hypothetical protein